MKTIKPILLAAAFFMLITASCKKSDTSPQTAAANLTFKFNGTAETSKLLVATYYKSQGTVQILATNGTQALGLTIENIKTGTFDLSTDQTLLLSYSTTADLNHTYIGTTGNVVITTFTSDTIAGTFQFSGTDGLGDSGAITGGVFSAKLVTQ